jgi:hypothetical protein
LARSITSFNVLTGRSGLVIRNSGAEPSRVMPEKFFTGSNGASLLTRPETVWPLDVTINV